MTVLFLTASVRSQDEDAAASGESTVAPVALPTAARILGDIPDGTPPPPQPPKPVFIVPAGDILASTTRQQGGRTITIRKIKPIALPPPPEPAPPPTDFDDAATRICGTLEHREGGVAPTASSVHAPGDDHGGRRAIFVQQGTARRADWQEIAFVVKAGARASGQTGGGKDRRGKRIGLQAAG